MKGATRLAAAAVMSIVAVSGALAQVKYPTQPVRVIVTVAPGSGLDTFARLLTRELSARVGQQFIADNRPGAGTTMGTAAAARAKPDGYTLLVTTAAFAISPAIYRSIAYDPARDFAPITMAVTAPNLMVVHPSVPVKSVKDLIALAKARASQGDPIFYASGGNGSNGHLATALFLEMARIRMTHVPYKSGSLAQVGVIAGQVPMMSDSIASLLPHVRTGKLRPLGVSSTRRADAAPEIATIAEVVPGYESAQWYALLAPAGTPQEIVAWIHKETMAVLHSAEVRERLAADGGAVVGSTPEELAAILKVEIAKWARIVKSAGIPLM
jgi:tripartite-type tricarboxylate transporter receptor subunit TctC